MLKKTTIYIEEAELQTLKMLSLIQNKSVTELIRRGIKEVCEAISPDEMKALESLVKIKQDMEKSGRTDQEITNTALNTQRKIRSEQTKRNRRH